jgi:hypothetical protein
MYWRPRDLETTPAIAVVGGAAVASETVVAEADGKADVRSDPFITDKVPSPSVVIPEDGYPPGIV